MGAGVVTDPGALNTSLKNQNDFIGTDVNWSAATRDAASDTLEFHAFRTSDMAYLSQAIAAGHPVIAGVNLNEAGAPSHFVVSSCSATRLAPTRQTSAPFQQRARPVLPSLSKVKIELLHGPSCSSSFPLLADAIAHSAGKWVGLCGLIECITRWCARSCKKLSKIF